MIWREDLDPDPVDPNGHWIQATISVDHWVQGHHRMLKEDQRDQEKRFSFASLTTTFTSHPRKLGCFVDPDVNFNQGSNQWIYWTIKSVFIGSQRIYSTLVKTHLAPVGQSVLYPSTLEPDSTDSNN
ncbi:MAG: hypothetical protein CMB79_20355 [Filomicrobium sp.]|nr:hypothetical protein [Filomicrobium sp.]